MTRSTTNRISRRTLRVENLERRHLLASVLAGNSQNAVVKVNTVDNNLPVYSSWSYFPSGGVFGRLIDTIDVTDTASFSIQPARSSFAEPPILAIKTPPLHGQLKVDAVSNALLYTPDRNFEGIDHFEYQFGENNIQPYSVRVAQPLYAADDWFQIAADIRGGVRLNVLENDGANFASYAATYRDSLRIVNVSSKTGNSVVSVEKDGKSIRIESKSNKPSSEVFEYTVEDSEGYRDTALVTVAITDPLAPFQSSPEQTRILWMNQLLNLNANSFGIGSLGRWADLQSIEPMSVVFSSANLLRAVDSAFGNNQVAGVDENDVVESNGSNLFILSNVSGKGKLTIIDVSSAANPTIVSELDLTGWQSSLHLVDNRLTVLSTVHPADSADSVKTKMTIIDVSDKSRPSILKTIEMQGPLHQSRLVGDKLYVFSSGISVAPQLDRVSGFFETAHEYIDRIWNELSLGPQLTVTQFNAAGALTSRSTTSVSLDTTSKLLDSSRQLVGIYTFDLSKDDMKPVDIDTFTAGWDFKLFVTNSAIYVATNRTTTVSNSYVTQSLIEQYSIDPIDGKVQLKATGKTAGVIQNSFSMGEYHGDLQVFTTVNQWSNDSGLWQSVQPQLYNKLSILRPIGSELVEVGSIDDIAPNEQIQSARFEGDKAYVVTFRQIDPFFVIDLSNPTAPKIKGELKIPGYSQYLHQIDASHILGIGRDVDENGVDHGLKVALFDVSDLAAPKQVGSISMGPSTYSPVTLSRVGLSDHRALGVFLNRGIIALPFYKQEWSASSQFEVGVFRFDGSSLTLIGKTQSEASIDRVMQFGDYMYSMSQNKITVNELLHPERESATLVFENAQDGNNIAIEETKEITKLIPISPTISLVDNVWHNTTSMHDVNGDAAVDSMDVLNLINFINAIGDGQTDELSKKSVANPSSVLRRFFDVNNDQIVSSQDVLVVINYINSTALDQLPIHEGESEGGAEDGSAFQDHDEMRYMVDLESDPTLRKLSLRR